MEQAKTHLIKNALQKAWDWYRYEFQLRGATHGHGMLQLKLSPPILKLVAKVYSRRKAMEKLELARIYQELSDDEKE